MTPSADPAFRYWQAVAVHEGAHAAVALHLGLTVEEVVLAPADEPAAAGVCRVDPYGPWRSAPAPHLLDGFAQAQVMCRLAGPEAEAKWGGRPNPTSARFDLAEAREWAARLTLRDPRPVVGGLTRRVRRMLEGYPLWPVTLTIADALLRTGRLSGGEVAAVYHRTVAAEAIEERVMARVRCRG